MNIQNVVPVLCNISEDDWKALNPHSKVWCYCCRRTLTKGSVGRHVKTFSHIHCEKLEQEEEEARESLRRCNLCDEIMDVKDEA